MLLPLYMKMHAAGLQHFSCLDSVLQLLGMEGKHACPSFLVAALPQVLP
jgi:hypothetical protein